MKHLLVETARVFLPLLDPARYKAVRALGVSDQFRILHDRIITPGGGTINFVGLATHTIESLDVGFVVAGHIRPASRHSIRFQTLLESPSKAHTAGGGMTQTKLFPGAGLLGADVIPSHRY